MRLEERVYTLESTKGDVPDRFLDDNFVIAINDIAIPIKMLDLFSSNKKQGSTSTIKGHSFLYRLKSNEDGYIMLDRNHKVSFYDRLKFQTYYIKSISRPVILFDDVIVDDDKLKDFIDNVIISTYKECVRNLEQSRALPKEEKEEQKTVEDEQTMGDDEGTTGTESISDEGQADQSAKIPELNFEDDDNQA